MKSVAVDETRRRSGEEEIQRILAFLSGMPRPFWEALEGHDYGTTKAVVAALLQGHDPAEPLPPLTEELVTQAFRERTRLVHPDQFHHRGDEQLLEQATSVQALLISTRRMGLSLVRGTFNRERNAYNAWLRSLRETAEQARAWGVSPLPRETSAPPPAAAEINKGRSREHTASAKRHSPVAPPREKKERAPNTQVAPPPPASSSRRRGVQQPPSPPAIGTLTTAEMRWLLLVTRLKANDWRDSIAAAWSLFSPSRSEDALSAEQRSEAQQLAHQLAANPTLYEHFREAEGRVGQTDLWHIHPFQVVYMQEVVSPRLSERLCPTSASEADRIEMSPRMLERFVRDIQHQLSITDQRVLGDMLRQVEQRLRSGQPRPTKLNRGSEQILGRFRAAVARVLRGRSPDQRERIWNSLLQAMREGDTYS